MRRKTTTTIRQKPPSKRDAKPATPAAGADAADADKPKTRSGAKARMSGTRIPADADSSTKAGGSAARLKSRRVPSGSQAQPAVTAGDEVELHQYRQRSRQGMSITAKMALYFTSLIFLFCAVFSLVVVFYVWKLTSQQIFNQGENLIIGLPEIAMQFEQNSQKGESIEDEKHRLRSLLENNELIHHIRIYTGLKTNPQIIWHEGDEANTYEVTREAQPSRYANVFIDGNQTWSLAVQEAQIREGHHQIYVYDFYREQPTRLGVSLAYSREKVMDEVFNTVLLLLLIGVFFVVAGLIFAYGLATSVTRPINILIKDLEVVAGGNLDHQTQAHSRDEIGVLAATFNDMTTELRKAQERAIYMQRIEADLEAARDIQNRLLPKRKPNLPGIDLDVKYESAKQVGGDYYDFIPVDKENLGFVIADVSGKGVPAAMVMATTRTLLRLYAVANLSPADTLSKVNRELTRDLKRGMFVTTLYMILNPATRVLSIASAGHNPLIIYRAKTKSVELKNPNGIALGFDGGPIFNKVIREEKVQLDVGDRVVIYTDGVTESMSPSRKEWGSDTLYEFTRRHADLGSEEFVNTLREALRVHQGDAEQHDDISYVTFRMT